MQRIPHILWLMLLLLLPLVSLKAQSTYTVTNTNETGPGSFEQGVIEANNPGGPTRIEFGAGVPDNSTIYLSTSTFPHIKRTVTIDGGTKNIMLHRYTSLRIDASAVNTVIRNIGVTGSYGNAGIVLMSGCTGVVIENCTVVGTLHGILVNKGNNITIRNCKIGVKGAAQTLADAHYNYDGIVINNCTNVTITGNVISGNKYKGIWVRGTKNPLLHADLPRGDYGDGMGSWPNTTYFPADPILFEPSTAITIENNKIGVSTNGSVKIPNQDGIFIEGSHTLIIRSNVIGGNSSVGLNFDQNASIGEISGNTIGASVTGPETGNNYGVVIRSSTYIKLGSEGANNISGNTSVGVEVPASKVGIEIVNNDIGYTWSNTILGNDTGIVIKEGSQHVLVKGNRITNNNKFGIVVRDKSYYNKITTNYRKAFNGSPSILLSGGGNFMKEKPVIQGFENSGNHWITIVGTAQPFDTVEVFESDKELDLKNAFSPLGRAQADANGIWKISGSTLFDNIGYAYFVATATDRSGNTSELSDVFKAVCNANVDIELFTTQPDCGECNGAIESVLSRGGYFTYRWFTPCNSTWKEGDTRTLVGEGSSVSGLCEGQYIVQIVDEVTGCGTSKCIDLFPREEHACEGCVSSFSPTEDKEYHISTWVKEVRNVGYPLDSFPSPKLTVQFVGAGLSETFNTSGKVIDGWQKIEGTFKVPGFTSELSIMLENKGSNSVYFDDIRIHPLQSNMETYVFDPVTLRLVAKLDENNYATFYEYDEEGSLVRVKKETERGIMTIRETRDNISKIREEQ